MPRHCHCPSALAVKVHQSCICKSRSLWSDKVWNICKYLECRNLNLVTLYHFQTFVPHLMWLDDTIRSQTAPVPLHMQLLAQIKSWHLPKKSLLLISEMLNAACHHQLRLMNILMFCQEIRSIMRWIQSHYLFWMVTVGGLNDTTQVRKSEDLLYTGCRVHG